MQEKNISHACVLRLPMYLSYLRIISDTGNLFISATSIAKSLGLGEVQVRKDLSSICSTGRPKIGYDVNELISCIERHLNLDKIDNVIIVGAGKLGRALLDYDGFEIFGLKIVAAFDENPELVGQTKCGKPIKHMNELSRFCRDNNIRVGLITVPVQAAQSVCDKMVSCGITAIMNFAPVRLIADKTVSVKNEDIAVSLALLSKTAN